MMSKTEACGRLLDKIICQSVGAIVLGLVPEPEPEELEAVDEALVYGITNRRGQHRFPSYSEIAEYFGLARQQVADYAERHDCLRRRKALQLDEEGLMNASQVDGTLREWLRCAGSGEIACETREDLTRLKHFGEMLMGVRCLRCGGVVVH